VAVAVAVGSPVLVGVAVGSPVDVAVGVEVGVDVGVAVSGGGTVVSAAGGTSCACATKLRLAKLGAMVTASNKRTIPIRAK
jgi:hypothetical protein